MKYPGSKARLAKHLLPIIFEHKDKADYYLEPFCGGCNMIDKAPDDIKRYGCDSNKYIIAYFRALQSGWLPPEDVSEEDYRGIKNNKDNHPPEFVAHVGISCSFGGKWFGGYARDKKHSNYSAIGMRHALKQLPKIKDVIFQCRSFETINPVNAIVYCDPPYANTIKYKDEFNHELFWNWVRKISANNYVYVSEYVAPDDFECVYEVEHKTTIDMGQHDKRIERLFAYKG